MPKTVDELEQEIILAAGTFSFVQRVLITDKNPVALKARLELGPEFFVQVYVNVMTGTQNLVLVLGRQRLFARDCVGSDWHRHPFSDPDAHDVSAEGAKPATIAEFLSQVQEIVENAGLL